MCGQDSATEWYQVQLVTAFLKASRAKLMLRASVSTLEKPLTRKRLDRVGVEKHVKKRLLTCVDCRCMSMLQNNTCGK